MNKIAIAAGAATVVISLLNLPIGFSPGDIPAGLAWAVTGMGIVGLVAAAGLVRRAPWGAPAILAVGGANLASAFVALLTDEQGAVIGLALSAAIVVLAVPLVAGRSVVGTSTHQV